MNCEPAIIVPRMPLILHTVTERTLRKQTRRKQRIVGDMSGNLKLKNISSATGSTAGPTTTSSTYAVIAEMTVTVTTKGNKIFITFSGSFDFSAFAAGSNAANFAIFRDGTQLTADLQDALGNAGSESAIIALTWTDSPSAASHTYDVRWKAIVQVGTTLRAVGTQRQLQVTELG